MCMGGARHGVSRQAAVLPRPRQPRGLSAAPALQPLAASPQFPVASDAPAAGRPLQLFRRRAHAAAAAAAGDGSAPQQLVPVFEYLVLFQLKADCQPEQAVAALEALWGLQIRLPGCMCAFGGPVLQDGAFLHGTGVTHMLHMRFTSRERADAFRQHPVVREAFRTEVQPVAGELVEVLFQADVERDMDAMFRKGGEWEAGAEMLLLLRAAQPGAGSAGGAAAFAQRLAALARESRSEALQASVGLVLQLNQQLQADGSAQLALMVRFPTQQQLRWFVESPPYQALLAGDSRLPASAVLAATCELLPAERQQNKAAPLHVTDR